MSQSSASRLRAHDPRLRQRSPELQQLLAHCPEHLFSTDDDELAPIDSDTDTGNMTAAPADLEKAA